MKLIIKDDEDRKTVVPLVRDEVSIGRHEANTIRLTERNVSRKHARLLRENGAIYIEDLDSSNGVRVNGNKISAKSSVKEGDLIEIGDYALELEDSPGAAKSDGDTSPAARSEPALAPPPRAPRAQPVPVAAPAPAPRTPASNSAQNAAATAMIRISDLGMSAEADEERDLSSNEQPRLVGLTGNLRGKDFPLRRSVVKIGRTDENDLVIDHQSMSRQHARMQIEAGGWVLYDNKSANGVKVNGDEYQKSAVKPGDTVEFGHARFRFCAPGEAFTPPREAPAAGVVAAASSSPQSAPAAAPSKSKLPLILGIVGGVVVLAVIGVVVATSDGGKDAGPDTKKLCSDAQVAIGAQSWDAAIAALNSVKAVPGGSCSFGIDEALAKSRTNKDAKSYLQEADDYIAGKRFSQAIAVLENVTADSVYASDAKLKVSDAKRAYVRKLSDDASDALGRKSASDLGAAIRSIEAIDPEAPNLSSLRASQKGLQASSAPSPSAAPPPPPPPPAQASQADRDGESQVKLAEATTLIKGGNIEGGITVLKEVVGLRPSPEYLGKAYRNLGVANARAGRSDEAIKFYRFYLKVVPNAPEKAKIEELIRANGQ